MILNHLFVVPTDETLKYLGDMMAATPIHGLDLNNLRVSIMITADEIEAEPEKVYTAHAGSIMLQRDAEVEGTSMILPLVSEDLFNANKELQAAGVQPAFFEGWYVPHMKFISALPPMRRYIKAWINSISTTLYTQGATLTFTGEQVLKEDFVAIPDYYFMVETMRQAGINTQFML